MRFAPFLLAVDALVLQRENDLLGQRVKLGDLLIRQAGEDIVSRLVVRGHALLGNGASLVGQLHRVRALLVDVLDGHIAVAGGLLHDVLEVAAVQAEDAHKFTLGDPIVLHQRVEQRALPALEAFRTVLAKRKANELAGFLQLGKGLGRFVHTGFLLSCIASYEHHYTPCQYNATYYSK